jgi:hypothetical protein
MYRLLGADNKEYGPVTAEQLRQWIGERRLNAQSLVQAEGSTGWRPLSLFPEFSATLGNAAPPPSLSGPVRPLTTPGPGNNGMAVASLICGCVGFLGTFCCLTVPFAGLAVPLAGIVLGLVAVSQLKANPGQEGKGMAIAGIILSAAGLLISIGTTILVLAGGLLQHLSK